jgi:hypothetical protein
LVYDSSVEQTDRDNLSVGGNSMDATAGTKLALTAPPSCSYLKRPPPFVTPSVAYFSKRVKFHYRPQKIAQATY